MTAVVGTLDSPPVERLASVARSIEPPTLPGRAWTPDWIAPLVVALLALCASATGLRNQFAYDDTWIIVQNSRVHTLSRWYHIFAETYWPLVRGAALYRPLTSLSYALEWWAGGGTPFVFHAMNVALYVAVSIAVYALATELLPRTTAWIAAALFAVHPVHVESVASVVGQAELWAALVVLLSVVSYIRMRRRGALSPRAMVGLTAAYALACMFKENAIVLPALFIAAEVVVIDDPRPARARLAALRPLLLALAMAGLAFVAIRAQIVGEVGGDTPNPVFTHLAAPERWLVMLGVVPEITRLLLVPWNLAPDYSPGEIPVLTRLAIGHLPGVVILFGLLVLGVATWRRSRASTFALAWIVVAMALVSNILVATGVVVAERTLFLPSVGVVLLLGVGADHLAGRLTSVGRRAASLLLAVVLIVAAIHSAARQRVWRDNTTLFSQFREDAPRNYRAHFAYGSMLFDRGDMAGGEREWRVAIALYPAYEAVYSELAHKYREAGLCAPAVDMYRKSLALEPSRAITRWGLASCLLMQGDALGARSESRRGLAYGPSDRLRGVDRLADSVLAARRTARP